MRYRYDDDDSVPLSLDAFGEQIKDELRQEYIQNENQKRFWDEFYGAYPVLRANRHTVLAVWQENIDEFMNSTPDSAMATLAKRATERVNWLDRTKDQRREAAAWVGGPGHEGVSANEQRIDVPGTMGDHIKGRKEARRAASRQFRQAQRPSNEPSYGRGA